MQADTSLKSETFMKGWDAQYFSYTIEAMMLRLPSRIGSQDRNELQSYCTPAHVRPMRKVDVPAMNTILPIQSMRFNLSPRERLSLRRKCRKVKGTVKMPMAQNGKLI